MEEDSTGEAYRQIIKEAVDNCIDIDLLDLIYKLLVCSA
jgi:hypothetical protein